MWPRVGARLLDAPLVKLVLLVLALAVPLPDGLVGWLLALVALVAYETSLLASGGQTFFKLLFGLRGCVPTGRR
jgi:hypothetical protein